MTSILGISAYFHDSAAAIVVDGRVVAAAQEERFSRIKHDAAFPKRSIEACLTIAGITADQLDLVVFYEKPLAKFERLIETYLRAAPRGVRSFTTAMPSWMSHKLNIRREIRRGLEKRYKGRIAFCDHHTSHAASAFFASPFDDAAIMTMDGVGEWATTTLGVGRGNEIEITNQIVFPDSIGLLYSAFTYHAGFRVNSGEYKLMGLAPYGTPKYADKIRECLIDIRDDGSFKLNQDYFDYATGLKMTSAKFDELFGGPRREPDSPIEAFHQDIAASIQAVTEEVVMKSAKHLHQITGQRRLCLAGGVALNCVANGKLLREGPFDDVWVQPAAGDAGGALGAALFGWHQALGNARVASEPDNSLLGPAWDEPGIRESLDRHGIQATHIGCPDELADQIAAELASGKVVGRMAGRMEFGPRALGNRSILADPRGADTQSRINQKIKFRESFRPFAPAVLADHAQRWFDMSGHGDSPFMMFVHPVRENSMPVPAVTHVDGTARVQTVDAQRNPDFERLLRAFLVATGCPMLVNTSFNVRGQPIVESPDDAIACFLATDLDVLVMENFVVRKSDVVGATIDRPTSLSLRQRLRKIIGVWHRIVSTIGLAIVYYTVVTPTGFWWRWRGRDESVTDGETYWRPVKKLEGSEHHFRTF